MTDTMRKKEHTSKQDSLCFSLELKERTRDFAALNREDFDMWVERLREMLTAMQEKRGKKPGDSRDKAPPSPSRMPSPSKVPSTTASQLPLPMISSVPPTNTQQAAQMQQSQYGKGTVLMSKKR